jgi:hypothetical protein
LRILLLALVMGLNLPILFVVGRLLFGGWRNFLEACEALFVVDLSSALGGDERDTPPGKFLLLLFFVFAIASTTVAYVFAARYAGIDPW